MENKLVFEPRFSDIKISADKVIRMLGGGDEAALYMMRNDLEEIFIQAEKLCEPYAQIQILPIDAIDEKNGLVQCKNTFSVGDKISAYFKGAEYMAVFVCTIGDKLEKWSRDLLEKGDFLKGYMADALGSLAVEKLMDLFQKELRSLMANEGLSITNRYSPGYCDWDVSEQQKLFSLLPSEFNVVSLSESSLMQPIKSVSGFIGIGSKVQYRAYRCKDCSSVECPYRYKK